MKPTPELARPVTQDDCEAADDMAEWAVHHADELARLDAEARPCHS